MVEEAELSDVTGTAWQSSEQFQTPGEHSVTGKMACGISEKSKNLFLWVKTKNLYFKTLEQLSPSHPHPPRFISGEGGMPHSILGSGAFQGKKVLLVVTLPFEA